MAVRISSGAAVADRVPAIAAVLRRIATDPGAPLVAAVIGPGGTGKTALLDAVAREYENAGIVLIRAGGDRPVPIDRLDPGKAVLVDDAHRLDAAFLDTLRAFAEAEPVRLVLGYRPWPRPSSLAALTAAVARRRVTVVVSHLDAAAVAARVSANLGCEPPAGLVDLVHAQSGGLPALVDLVTQALRDSGRFDPRRPTEFHKPQQITVSATLAERLRHRVDALEPDVYRLLEAMAVGAALDADLLAALLGTETAGLTSTVEAARATGLVTDAGELIPFVGSLFLRLMPMLRSRELQRQLAGIELDRGGSVLAAGRRLLGTGASGAQVARVLDAAAGEAAGQSPALAAELLAGSVEAGRAPREVAGRRSRAVALAGDLDQALRLADQVIDDPTAPDREQAVATVAAVLAHRGLLARSADLHRCLSPAQAVLAVPALVGTGALDDAKAVLDKAVDTAGGPATLQAGAATLMAQGMLASVAGPAPAALSHLVRAASLLEPVAATVLLPDTPAALTALVAVQCGEFALADDALRRAAAGQHGGRAAQPRHLLLHGWLELARGRLGAVRGVLARAARSGIRLEPRDELFAAALGMGLARRCNDAAALTATWARARGALVAYPTDLYTLLPLGELTAGAALLGEQDWVASQLAEAEALLELLGDPALWAVPLRWSRLHAALAAGPPEEAVRHAEALATARSAGPFAGALADAAQSWLQVSSGAVDADVVVAAARRLNDVGLSWEAAQLAGQAAAVSVDRRAVTLLHACARTFSPTATAADTVPGPVSGYADGAEPPSENQHDQHPVPRLSTVESTPAVSPVPAGGPDDADPSVLSERELEIGELILAGLTYNQIGQRLYISGKTVEHHVARIRRRLDVNTRKELFDRLRSVLAESRTAAS